MSISRLRIEYVVFNKLYDIIIKSRTQLPRGLLLIGPRSVGKSFILNRLMLLFLLRDSDILKNIEKYLSSNNLNLSPEACEKAANCNVSKEYTILKKLLELIKKHGVIPIAHDCKIDGNLSLKHIDKYVRALLGLANYKNEYVILLLVDNVHYCYESIHKIFDSFLAHSHIVVVMASPTAYGPRELKRKEFERIRFYPLRFGEISAELISQHKGDLNLPLKGEERRQKVININELINYIDNITNSKSLVNELLVLFALYSIFGGTIAGYNILVKIIRNNRESILSMYINRRWDDIGSAKCLERWFKSYVNALMRTYNAIVDDAIQVYNIDTLYKPYVEATFQVLAKLAFEDNNITLSREQLMSKAIEIGNEITLSPVNSKEARDVVKKTMDYLGRADILFEIKRYKFIHTKYHKSKVSDTKSAKYKYVYSDPRYLYAAYYGYLMHMPYDSIRDPSILMIEKLKDILRSMLCMGSNSKGNEKLIGTLLEMITLQNICLNFYGIRASADKPRDPRPACYGLYTLRVESEKAHVSDKEQSGTRKKSDCEQLEVDALIVQNQKPLYGVEISRSMKKKDELKCALQLANEIGFNTLFNVYLRLHRKRVWVNDIKIDNVKIVYVPVPAFLLATL